MNTPSLRRSVAPMIRWIGGKRRLAKKLIPLFPPHRCYVEAFCGSAALYFLREKPAPSEVLNDLNGDLINLYRVVQHHFDEFARQLEWAVASRQLFDGYQLMPPETLTDIQRAARFYYLQQYAFGAQVTQQHFGTATTSTPKGVHDLKARLAAAHQRMANTTIESLPWQQCIERYDRPHTFFYLDPPYWEKTGYGLPFELTEYEQIAEVMRRCQGKIMLSINDHPDMRAVFEGAKRTIELNIVYSSGSAHGRKESRELVMMNW